MKQIYSNYGSNGINLIYGKYKIHSMEQVILPTYNQYKDVVDRLVASDELTLTQGIILLKCFRARLDETACHVNYLMACTGLDWNRINYVLNGLVCRGAIRRIEQKYYTV